MSKAEGKGATLAKKRKGGGERRRSFFFFFPSFFFFFFFFILLFRGEGLKGKGVAAGEYRTNLLGRNFAKEK